MGLLKLIKFIARPAINQFKGGIGEKKVIKILGAKELNQGIQKVINNLILLDENGKSHQIDHVVIRENGIFCIETKNYIGYIFGGENDREWTQTLYNGQKNKLINPLKQNNSHIYHLSKVLKNEHKINSVVVMTQNNASNIKCSNVVNVCVLDYYLSNFKDTCTYSKEEVEKIYQTLMNHSSEMTNREHIKNVKQTQKELKKGICPRCGSILVLRDGKYGEFFGCSNYPKCKFILKK